MNQLTYNWWTVALRGVLAIIIGLVALFFPGVTLTVFVIFFGVFALLEGAFLVISGIRSYQAHRRWWVLLIQGIIGLAAGIIAFAAPLATALALIYLIAAWAIVTGVMEIAVAVRLRKEIRGEWVLIVDGVITVLFGLALMLIPGAGLLMLLWMFGGFRLASGVLLLILAYRLHKAQKTSAATGEV